MMTNNKTTKETLTMKRSTVEADPAANVEKARAELEAAETALAGFDAFKGTLDDAATRRRDLQARAELARERLTLAQARADAAADAETVDEIAILTEQGATIEAEIGDAEAEVSQELQRLFIREWLAGCGRFATCPPALPGLLSRSSVIVELVERRGAIQNEIARLENRLAEGRAQRDRAAAAARVELRRKLLAGETVRIALTPWRICPMEGHTSETAANFANRKIPCAILPNDDRQIHALIPSGSTPGQYVSAEAFLHAEPMDPDDLTPTMAEIWKRSR